MKKNIFLLIVVLLLVLTGCDSKQKKLEQKDNIAEEIIEKKEVQIVDLKSNSRPYAVVINNYPAAVKVQSGLNKAYMIYEIPIEGGITRSLAFFRDVEDVRIGTVRSARHNYIDYVKENDAIFVHFGWSHSAEEQIIKYGINNIDGNYMDPTPFYRENPEGLATEHTVYTNLKDIISYNNSVKKYKTTTDVKPILNYSVEEIDLSKEEEAKEANTLEIPYAWSYNIKFKYNEETRKYDRYLNDNAHVDYFTGEHYYAKNVIVLLLDWGYVKEYTDAAGNNYLDLNNVGTGKGYYLTNGYSIPITWNKENRFERTKYLYEDKEIDVNDGNTYIMIQSKNGEVKIK